MDRLRRRSERVTGGRSELAGSAGKFDGQRLIWPIPKVCRLPLCQLPSPSQIL
jgi:hypothetical protein